MTPLPSPRPASAGRRLAAAGAAVAVLTLLATPVALAHPLGNFTINHFAGLRVTPTAVAIELVLDLAEIPTFQERRRADTNGDGTLNAGEHAVAQAERCAWLASQIALSLDGAPIASTVNRAELTFPAGVAGIPTMRVECDLAASVAWPAGEGATLRFADRSYPERIGWREIVVQGDGVAVDSDLPRESISRRLTAYPNDLLAAPADQREATVRIGPVTGVEAGAGSPDAPTGEPDAGLGASVPGGIGGEVAAILAVEDLSPLAVLGTLLLAAGLGALHALSPGHGKTVMAAYLVGARGTPRHAIALGGIVTLSHTLGVLALGVLVLTSAAVVPPERLVPALATVSGVLFVAIGTWMLRDQLRERRRRRARAEHGHAARTHAHEHAHEHDHGHGEEHAHEHDHGHGEEHPHEFAADGTHRHGLVTHRHLPADGDVTWRRLVVLGLAGGLVPSVSALVLLLGSLAAGRPAYGLVLVVAFGGGMAAVLTGIGLALVHGRAVLERRIAHGGTLPGAAVTAARMLPIVAAVVVMVAGAWVTASSLGGFGL